MICSTSKSQTGEFGNVTLHEVTGIHGWLGRKLEGGNLSTTKQFCKKTHFGSYIWSCTTIFHL